MEKPVISFSPLTVLPTACVKDISIDSYYKCSDHYCFLIKIVGRTRFLHPGLARDNLVIEYRKGVRYSSLLELHKTLKKELKPYLEAAGKEMPEFPSKGWFTGKRELAEKRVVSFNNYFAQLFAEYSGVLLFSNALIDFFEPQRLDLNLVCLPEADSKEVMKTLAAVIEKSVVITKSDDCRGTAEISLKRNISSEELKDASSDWEKVYPLDYKYNSKLYRIDVQNLYGNTMTVASNNCNEGTNIELTNLNQTPYTACVFAFRLDDRKSYQKLQQVLKKLKLIKAAALVAGLRSMIPPFIVLGLGSEQTKYEVKYDEVINYLMDLFGDPCPYGYLEASYVTGHNIVESLEAVIDTVARKK